MTCNILDIPLTVIVDVLPFLSVPSVDALSQTCKQMRQACYDEGFWRRKIKADFGVDVNSLGHQPAQAGTSRLLWRGLRTPRVYVWGSSENGRLGVSSLRTNNGRSQHIFRAVHRPLEITQEFRMPSHIAERRSADKDRVGIVELQAGGWCFAARDYDGGVWSWGQLDGSGWAARPYDYEHSYLKCGRPTRLRMPCRAVSISQGRRHLMILDSDNLIWELRAWGRAYKHVSPQLTAIKSADLDTVGPASSTRRTPAITQVAAGWGHSAALNAAGDIFVWHPFHQVYNSAAEGSELHGSAEAGEDGLVQHHPTLEDNEIPVRWGDIQGEAVTKLPSIPGRPVDSANADVWAQCSEEQRSAPIENADRAVRIAAGDSFLLALRANGEVWLVSCDEGSDLSSAVWEFLPHLSSPDIRHISASFHNIVSYSRSCVLTATIPDERESRTGEIIKAIRHPDLQDKQTTSIVTGDYHSLALTASGEILASGQNGTGQLGIGEDDNAPLQRQNRGAAVEMPTRVLFGRGDAEDWQAARTEGSPDNGRDEAGDFDAASGPHRRFAFSVSAGGWHSGALVVDMKQGAPQTGRENTRNRADNNGAADGGSETLASDTLPGNGNQEVAARDPHDLPFQRAPAGQQGPQAGFMPFPFIRLGHAAGLAGPPSSDRPGQMIGGAAARRLGVRRPMTGAPQGGPQPPARPDEPRPPAE